MATVSRRLDAIALYLVMGPPRAPVRDLLAAAIDGGVGMVQLRDKALADRDLVALAAACATFCRERGVPFIVNDRADIALAAGADGVHVGQDDLPVETARALLGPQRIIGVSTHTPQQIDAARATSADYIGVGPIHETPTKPGVAAVGTDLVRYAAAHAGQPFFAIGGLDPANVAETIAAGASQVCVLRWVTQAADPRRAAREMRDAMQAATRSMPDAASAR